MLSDGKPSPVHPPVDDFVISVEGVGKRYQLIDRPADRLWQAIFRNGRRYAKEVTVLQDVNFTVRRGETVGIIGRNAAGKSTLLQIIAGTLRPSEGRVRTSGRIAPLIELGSGFNPELTGRENVFFNGLLLGMTDGEVRAKYDQIAVFADIGDYIERPVKTYSSGMYARLAFSVAAHLDPEILIIDEILSVGDAAFQRKCMKRFYEIRDRGCTILLVAHDEYMIRSVCQKALYLRAGRMVAFGDPVDVVGRYVEDTMTPVDQASTAGAQTGVSAGTDIVPIGVAAGGVYAVPPEAVLAQVAVVESAPSGDLTAASVDTTHSDSGVAAAEPSPAEKGVSTAADVPDKVYRITHVVLLDEAGHPVDLVKHGSTMHLEFTFEALTSDIPDKISFVFNLYAVTGEYICGTTTLMEGMAAHPGARAGRVRITFPNVRLLTGKYHWRVAINDGVGLQWFQNAVHVCPFRIIVDRYASAGLVHLDREWSIELHR